MIHFDGQTLKFRRGDSGSIVISLTSGGEKIYFVDGDIDTVMPPDPEQTGGLNFKIDFSTRARPWILTKVL